MAGPSNIFLSQTPMIARATLRFEVHEATGKERAIAGGGRYDGLVELFGGPQTWALGIAMGDVVLRLVLEDRGLLKAAEECAPRPDAFSSGKVQTDSPVAKSNALACRPPRITNGRALWSVGGDSFACARGSEVTPRMY